MAVRYLYWREVSEQDVPGQFPAEVTRRKQYICPGLLVVNVCRTCPIQVPGRELTVSASKAAVGR